MSSLLTEREKRQFRLNCKYINFCARNDIENVKICLSRGANVNWRHGSSQSGLHFCVTNNNNNNEELLDLLLLLYQPEVDVNIRCMRGLTPLMNACNTQSALFYALFRKNIECVKILRTVSKTNWNMKNSDGEYPIIIALKKQVIKETNT